MTIYWQLGLGPRCEAAGLGCWVPVKMGCTADAGHLAIFRTPNETWRVLK